MGSWVRSVTRQCNWRSATCSSWVRGATISLLSLSLSSRVVQKWQDDLDDRWLGLMRVGLNDRSDAIVLLRCDLLAPMSVIFLLFLSLFLFYFPRPEVIWSENRNGKSFPLFWLFDQLEMLFSLTEFEVTTKYPIFRKIIFGISLKSIQTQPKMCGTLVLWLVECDKEVWLNINENS